MAKQKLTDWFPGSVKPARKGVYEFQNLISGRALFARFDGKNWRYQRGTVESAARAVELSPRPTPASRQGTGYLWRGLTEQSK